MLIFGQELKQMQQGDILQWTVNTNQQNYAHLKKSLILMHLFVSIAHSV